MSSEFPEEYEPRTPVEMTNGTEHSDNANDRPQIKDRIRELRRVLREGLAAKSQKLAETS